MTTLIAYCGLDCAKCEAYLATQADDLVMKENLLAKWRVEFKSPNMTLKDVTCDGCSSNQRLGGYCPQCPVRACASVRNLSTCADCPEYACDKLEHFFSVAPDARRTLDALRAHLSQ